MCSSYGTENDCGWSGNGSLLSTSAFLFKFNVVTSCNCKCLASMSNTIAILVDAIAGTNLVSPKIAMN